MSLYFSVMVLSLFPFIVTTIRSTCGCFPERIPPVFRLFRKHYHNMKLLLNSGNLSQLTTSPLARCTALYLAWTAVPLLTVCCLFRLLHSDLAFAACFTLLREEDSLMFYIWSFLTFKQKLSLFFFFTISLSCWTGENERS